MTRPEFDDWIVFHQDIFPEVADWVRGRNAVVIFDVWFEAMTGISAADATACSKRMVAGSVEHPNRFEISRLPAAIIAGCPRRVMSGKELAGKVYNPWDGTIS